MGRAIGRSAIVRGQRAATPAAPLIPLPSPRFTPVLPPSRRPPFATLVRLRQELTKRLDVVLDVRTDAVRGRLADRLTTDAATWARDPSELRRMLAQRAAGRFPLVHLLDRDPDTLPDRKRLLELASSALQGDWSLFGQQVRVDATHAWTVHPITGASTDSRHWHRVRYMRGIDGGDVKFLWELNRHALIVRLAQGYFLTKDDRFADRAVQLLEGWIEQNPPARGINWTSSLEVAFRAVAWCWIWALTRESRAWDGPVLTRFLSSLWHHARHIERYDSTHHSPNTHLTGEALALVYVGASFPEFRRSALWTRRGTAILSSELARQVLDDGMHFERSVGYHRYTAEFYLHLWLLCRTSAIPAPSGLEARLRAMLDASAAFQCPDGSWPVIGDEDSGSTLLLATSHAQDHGPLLATGAAYFGNRAWLEHVRESALSGAWWLVDDAAWTTLSSHMASASAPRANAIEATRLPAAGYYIAREHGVPDPWHCVVDAGPHGGDRTGHAHTDLGHVEISRGSTRIVSDPGCSGYTIDPERRDWYRSEQAHACLAIDDVPLAVPSGSFSWTRVAPTPTVDEGDSAGLWSCALVYERDGTVGRLTHRRQVVLVPRWGVLIADWLVPSGSERVTLQWPLAEAPCASTAAGVSADRYLATWAHAPSATLESATIEPSVASPGYGREVSSQTLRLRYRCDAPTWLLTAFAEPGSSMSTVDQGAAGVRCSIGYAGRAGVHAAITLRAEHRPVLVETPRDGSTSSGKDR